MRIGVIGAGLMGHGIAQAAAAAGHDVLLTDVDTARAEAGKAKVETGLARLVAKGSLEPGAAEALLGRITPAGDRAGFREADLVIEAATENVELKKRIFAGLGAEAGAETVFATNTSSISITMLGSVTDRPDRFIGLHFFNPVPVMKLVEIIPGLATSDDIRAFARAFVQSLGKTAIVAEDSPSFIVNRVLCPMLNEAIFALGEGVGTETRTLERRSLEEAGR
jgi:3-hydroxybutyryl-CoA dehydrogenase